MAFYPSVDRNFLWNIFQRYSKFINVIEKGNFFANLHFTVIQQRETNRTGL